MAVINAVITSNFNSNEFSKRFPIDITISEFKEKVEFITGASHENAKLYIMDKSGSIVKDLTNEDGFLEKFCKDDNNIIFKVVDKTINKGNYEDVSQVEKYNISDEAYAQRNDSLRNFLVNQGISPHSQKSPHTNDDGFSNFNLDDRCKVTIKGQPIKYGNIMYLGETKFKDGIWVGVKYDLPLGKNDGSVDGIRYFKCMPKYGVFVRPQAVEVGDFPEDDIEDLEL